MAKQTLNTLKSWFKTGLKPLQQQFWDWMDSFWHKDEKIPADSVEGLQDMLNGFSTTQALQGVSDGLQQHVDDTKNPHNVTATQVGLGNVDNTSDINKPVSTLMQEALDEKADGATLDSHTADKNNPHAVTKEQVGLDNVDNTSDINKPVSTLMQEALDEKADGATLDSHTADKNNPHAVTKEQVGLDNVDNTSDINKPVSTLMQEALDEKADGATLDSHTADKNNPHAVTKEQVGLGNVDNTSDADKPVSTATQAAINAAQGSKTLADVLNAGNTAIAGTASKAPVVFSQGKLLTTAQPGALEYDGTGLYVTLQDSTRRNMLTTDRVFKIYSRDYNNNSLTYTLSNWNINYQNDIYQSQAIVATIDIEMSIMTSAPGMVISVSFQNNEVYKLNINETVTFGTYVIGSFKVNQDIKYTNMFYIKGAVEQIGASLIVSTNNTAFRMDNQSFANPTLTFRVTGGSARIGATVITDKQQPGRSIY